jgi:hypothetical protein
VASGQQLASTDAERSSQGVDLRHAHIPLPAFDRPDIRPVQTGKVSQCLLREAVGSPHLAKPVSEGGEYGAIIGHGGEAAGDDVYPSTDDVWRRKLSAGSGRLLPTRATGGSMATVDDLERRIRQLEVEVQRLKSTLSDAGRLLKRSQDPNVQRAGRELY